MEAIDHFPWCPHSAIPPTEKEKEVIMSATEGKDQFSRFNGCSKCALASAAERKVDAIYCFIARRRHRKRMTKLRAELGGVAFDFAVRAALRRPPGVVVAPEAEAPASETRRPTPIDVFSPPPSPETKEPEPPAGTPTPQNSPKGLVFGWKQRPDEPEEEEEAEDGLKEVQLNMDNYTLNTDHFEHVPSRPATPEDLKSSSDSEASNDFEIVPDSKPLA